MSAPASARPEPPALVVAGYESMPGLVPALAAAGVAPPLGHVASAAVARLAPSGACGLGGWEAELFDGRRLRARSVVLAAVRSAPRPLDGALGGYCGRLLASGLMPTAAVAGARVLVVDRDARRVRSDAEALASVGADVHIGLPEGSSPMRRTPAAVLQHGEAVGADGQRIRFADGSAECFDAIVTPVHRPIALPGLDPGMLDWDDGHPRLVAGLLVPGLANLYIHGLGDGSMDLSRRARLLAAMMTLQADLDHPLVDDVLGVVQPSCDDTREGAGRALRRVERVVSRRARTRRRALVLQPGAQVPLDAARAV